MPRHARPRPTARAARSARPARRRAFWWSGLLLGLAAVVAGLGVPGLATGLETARASRSCPQGTTDQVPVARVNLGGPAVTVDGQTWSADPYLPATGAAATTGGDIAGTRADELYRTAHEGDFAYEVAVPAKGRYVTRLHFAELADGARSSGDGRGRRVFSVNVEGGRPEVRDLDLAASHGVRRAVVLSSTNRVRDGKLTIVGRGSVGRPVISAVEVLHQLSPGTCRPVTFGAAQSGEATAAAPVPTPAAPTTTAPAPSAPAQEQAPSTSAPATPAPSSPVPAIPPVPARPGSSLPAAAGAAIAMLTVDAGRPFSAASAWNTPVGANPVLDPRSAAMVRSVAPSNRATANLYAYGDPVFTAVAGTPTATVDCTEDWGTCDLEGRPIRIPADAKPTAGSDGRMIIVDLAAGTSCDFWQARKAGTGRWTTSWGTCAPLAGHGSGPQGGATGGGVNALAGVIRTFEMRSLTIPHALSIATDNSCAGQFRAPATKTDGSSTRSDCVPEGARLQLDPSIDVEAIPGITPAEKAVARALQVYGAINRDNCGSNICVAFEAPIGEADPYPAVGLDHDYHTMPNIPWTRLRVIAD